MNDHLLIKQCLMRADALGFAFKPGGVLHGMTWEMCGGHTVVISRLGWGNHQALRVIVMIERRKQRGCSWWHLTMNGW